MINNIVSHKGWNMRVPTRDDLNKLVSDYGAESYCGALPGREYVAHSALMAAIDSIYAELDAALAQSGAYLRRLNVVSNHKDIYESALLAIRDSSKCACDNCAEWCDGVDISAKAISLVDFSIENPGEPIS